MPLLGSEVYPYIRASSMMLQVHERDVGKLRSWSANRKLNRLALVQTAISEIAVLHQSGEVTEGQQYTLLKGHQATCTIELGVVDTGM
jgi:hypothetical protein